SSYCHKVLIALYENGTAFTPQIIDFGNAVSRENFYKLWPIGKFPLLQDDTTIVPESSIIIEYLDQYHPGAVKFIPADPKLALECRTRDRFFDLHVHHHVQRIVGDRIRPAGNKDPYGLDHSRTRLRTALDMAEASMAGRAWALGDVFSMADCA